MFWLRILLVKSLVELAQFGKPRRVNKHVAHVFGEKWGCNNYHARSVLHDIVCANEGGRFELTAETVGKAFANVKNKFRCDWQGLSVKVFELLFISQPDCYISWLVFILGSVTQMAACTPCAVGLGKEGSHTTASKVRVVVPLPAFLQIADSVLAIMLDEFLSIVFLPSPLLWEGARKHTQQADIVSGLSLFIEKSLDRESAGAIAQEDVRQHYDNIDAIKVFRWLVSHHCSPTPAAAFLRHQLLRSRACWARCCLESA